jgi:hypothetical protein
MRRRLPQVSTRARRAKVAKGAPRRPAAQPLRPSRERTAPSGRLAACEVFAHVRPRSVSSSRRGTSSPAPNDTASSRARCALPWRCTRPSGPSRPALRRPDRLQRPAFAPAGARGSSRDRAAWRSGRAGRLGWSVAWCESGPNLNAACRPPFPVPSATTSTFGSKTSWADSHADTPPHPPSRSLTPRAHGRPREPACRRSSGTTSAGHGRDRDAASAPGCIRARRRATVRAAISAATRGSEVMISAASREAAMRAPRGT